MNQHAIGFITILLSAAIGAEATGETPSLGGKSATTIAINPTVVRNVTGTDDVAKLKHLAAGIGWEFEPNADTTVGLKAVGMKTIRCINVDPLPGRFAADGSFQIDQPDRLLAHLKTCRELGASPHVIMATGLHPDLRLTVEDVQHQPGLMDLIPSGTFGPKNWANFRRYCQAYFEYVLVTQQFPDAHFEVGNEPDIGGTICPTPPKPANGSQALYEAYLNLYRNVALAAAEFEQSHPGAKVRLGGPALAWAFTFKYGDFNWAERFLRDCGDERLKLDFIGLHFYGNISSLNGEYPANYPSFREMLQSTKGWRDRYCPGVPIRITEWGASYHTSNEPHSVVNGNHLGAVWAAAFLNTMLESGVDAALYLVTTDLRQSVEDAAGRYENVWGWPSLFVNPNVFGKAYPKAPYHVFEMVSRLEGSRIEAVCGEGTVNCIASVDRAQRRLTVLVWNYGLRLPESGMPVENAQCEAVVLRVKDAEPFFGSRSVRVVRWMVANGVGDAHARFAEGQALNDQTTALQELDNGTCAISDGRVDIGFAAPASSVSLVKVAAE